jgi:hypothetical protein
MRAGMRTLARLGLLHGGRLVLSRDQLRVQLLLRRASQVIRQSGIRNRFVSEEGKTDLVDGDLDVGPGGETVKGSALYNAPGIPA